MTRFEPQPTGRLGFALLRSSGLCTRPPAVIGAGITAADDDKHIGLICSRCARVTPHAPETHQPFRHIIPVTARASLAVVCASEGA